MTRRWQQVALAALAVAVLGGFMPLWPDAVRIVALVVAAGLAAVALVLRRRARHDLETRADWGGEHDAALERDADRHRDQLPPDTRLGGFSG